MKKLDRLQFLPGVIGLYYVVHTISYSGGSEHFRLSEILAALLIVLAFANAFVIGLAIARKKTPMKLLLASLIVLMTLFYGSISDMLFAYPAVPEFVRKYVWGKNNVFCIFLLSAAFGIIMLVVKANPLNIQGIGKGLTIFFLTLICADIAIPHRNPSTLQVLPSWTPGTIRFQGEKPDVYFIIFDPRQAQKV